MTIKYPSELDTDSEIPRVDDSLTEISGETFNRLREAIFAIEKAIGVSPQGTTASLVARLAAALNDDGTFRASALVAAGLIALPITNSMIGASAAIAESKLDLDVATQILQDQISSNDVDILALQDLFTTLISNFNQHIAGTALQHESFDILIDVALTGIASLTVGGALAEINTNAIAHAAAATAAAHIAANVAISATYGGVSVTNAQEAFDALDGATTTALVKHRDDHHANGIGNWANSIEEYNTN